MLSDDTIFLTGFPGFIAGRLVERLARAGARFQLLVQPALAARAREELARIAGVTGRAGAQRATSGSPSVLLKPETCSRTFVYV